MIVLAQVVVFGSSGGVRDSVMDRNREPHHQRVADPFAGLGCAVVRYESTG